MWNRTNYTLYNSKKDVEELNLNTYNRDRATIFPYGVYSGDILPVDDYICGQNVPRSTDSDYIIDRERLQHPDHFSRFGSARSFYGYSVGNWAPGRFTPNFYCEKFEPFTPPPDLAPARFYKDPNVGPFSDRSSAYEGSLKARLSIPPSGPLLVDGPPGIRQAIKSTGA